LPSPADLGTSLHAPPTNGYRGMSSVERMRTPAPDVWLSSPSDAWRISPLVVHTLEAGEDAEIIEVSTPQLEDVVRLEDRYGRMT
jgi:hypothetical protein